MISSLPDNALCICGRVKKEHWPYKHTKGFIVYNILYDDFMRGKEELIHDGKKIFILDNLKYLEQIYDKKTL